MLVNVRECRKLSIPNLFIHFIFEDQLGILEMWQCHSLWFIKKCFFFFKSPEDLYILCRQKVSLYLFYRLETESSENVTDWPKNDPSACAQFCKNVPLYQGLMMVSSEHSCSVVLFLGFEI